MAQWVSPVSLRPELPAAAVLALAESQEEPELPLELQEAAQPADVLVV